MHSGDNFHVLALCQMQGSSSRRLKGSSATVDRGSDVLFHLGMITHSAVHFSYRRSYHVQGDHQGTEG